MSESAFDENGWARGAISLLPLASAWTLLSPEPDARVDAARWAHQADRFFRARLAVSPEKRYPAGTLPIADRVLVEIAARGADPSRALVVTVPVERAPEAIAAAKAGAQAIGGAGFDALVPRTRRVWQIEATLDTPGDARAPLAIAAVLASLFLAPIVPPGGGTIFGVKGARERLAREGWTS